MALQKNIRPKPTDVSLPPLQHSLLPTSPGLWTTDKSGYLKKQILNSVKGSHDRHTLGTIMPSFLWTAFFIHFPSSNTSSEAQSLLTHLFHLVRGLVFSFSTMLVLGKAALFCLSWRSHCQCQVGQDESYTQPDRITSICYTYVFWQNLDFFPKLFSFNSVVTCIICSGKCHAYGSRNTRDLKGGQVCTGNPPAEEVSA